MGEQDLADDILDEEEKQELKYFKRLFRFLQLLCEGHNNKLQNFLRQQNFPSGRSIDFVFYSAIIFSNFIKFVNIHSLNVCEQVLDFIIESVQGPCPEN